MEKEKGYSVCGNIKYVFQGVFKWQPCLLPMMILYVITSTALMYIIPFMTKLVIAQIESGSDVDKLFQIVLICGLVQMVALLVQSYIDKQKWWRFIYCRVKFIHINMKKIMTMNYEKLEDPKILDMSEKAQRACGDGGYGINAMMNTFLDTLVVVAKIISAFAVIGTLNLYLVLIVGALTLFSYIPISRTKMLDKKEAWDAAAPFYRKRNYFTWMMRDFSYGKDIRLFSMKEWLYQKRRGNDSELQEKIDRSRDLWLRCNTFNQGVNLIKEIILYGWLVFAVLYQGLTIANFTLYLATIHNFSDVMGEISWKLADLKRQSEEVNDYRMFVEGVEEKEGEEFVGKEDLDQIVKEGKYEFTFENVSFQYTGQETFALKNMNLTMKPGERLAVVGLNGAGKSTFIKLLCRLYDPTEGRILLNGIDIRKFEKVKYFGLFAPVFQNVEIYAFPMASNISMRDLEETEIENTLQAAKQAGLSEKIENLKNGVITQLLKVIDENGVDLSGGESQKLALARALYKDAPVILLDEPTSALDAVAEARMYETFDDMIGKKNAVYISHRLSSTRFCDHIAMFQGGELVEYGNHEELVSREGAYAEMFHVQAQYYENREKEKLAYGE